MNTKIALLTVAVLGSIFSLSSSVFSEEPVINERQARRENVRKLLEQGQKDGSLPEGVVIRVNAHFYSADQDKIDEAKARGVVLENTLVETWEFTSKEVHRLVYEEDQQGKWDFRKVDSLPFDSKLLCKELLDGQFLEIGTGKGKGEPTQYVGTHFHTGGRSVAFYQAGEKESSVSIGEHCTHAGYPESDARLLGELYEKLAKQAREKFAKKDALSQK